MPQKYYNVKETAKLLDITEAQVKQMLDARELHGYRDGADWKFKSEDIERLAKERASRPAAAAEDGADDVLMSELELGGSEISTSGTVIGMDPAERAAVESDIHLADSDVGLSEEKPAAKKPAAPAGKGDVASKVSQFEELNLTLDEDLTLEDTNVVAPAGAAVGGSDSSVDLSGKTLDDDDLVLGGSGTGSDITIAGDSGISLVDPSDSGLSLEEPLNLAGGGEESLELGEDDLVAASTDTGTITQVKSEDDFQLTTLEEVGEADESDSGSQVIALDTEGEGNEAATMIATGGGAVASLLDEDLVGGLGGMPLVGTGLGDVGLGAQPAGVVAGTPLLQPAIFLPEAPYSIWNVLGLLVCTIMLMLVGMLMYDVVLNIWSWQGSHGVNSALMDWVLGLFEK
ncbi:MAG: helix-turn-helix domain-containing protein [Thermoguttaceae bacterium]|jgi:excisionase family DNA binding protein